MDTAGMPGGNRKGGAGMVDGYAEKLNFLAVVGEGRAVQERARWPARISLK